jgi:phosphatidylserine decarboxylase
LAQPEPKRYTRTKEPTAPKLGRFKALIDEILAADEKAPRKQRRWATQTMSPLSVHYNRAPLRATVAARRQYPAVGRNLHMGSMHWRCLLRRLPIYGKSPHILQNNRAVTRFCGSFRGEEVACCVVQIGGGSVHGIDVYPEVGQAVEKGEIFGMIRIGSQVDLIVPDLPGLTVRVAPGDRVVAGETILLE